MSNILYRTGAYKRNVSQTHGEPGSFGVTVFDGNVVIVSIGVGTLDTSIHLERSALDVIIAECKAAKAAIAQHGAAQGQGAQP